ncbi:MAG TPA: zinc-binding dehydrogenase [Methylomirabilota bacterium]|nr:zinc-binding dehydrogenase [Methylomirabilota bacterium]
MKAAVLPAVGAPLRIEDIPIPTPRAGEVRLRIRACGVCHTDLHVMKGEVKFPVPAVLGHEVSGIVEATGPGVTGLEHGTAVVASFIMPCGHCRFCAVGRDDLCETFFALNRLKGVLYDGETRLHRADGSPLAMYSMAGLAEHCVVPVTDVFPLPAGLAVEDACILGCALMTAYGAVKHQGALRATESVAVVGVGGVGSNVIQLAKVVGASRILAVDVRREKLDAARRLGATDAVDAGAGDAVAEVRRLTGGEGVDVAFEVLGRPETVTAAFKMVRDGGRVVVIGIAAGTTPAPIEITHLVRRGIRLQGSYGARVRGDMPELIGLAARGQVSVSTPISRRYHLDQAAEAYGALDRGEITGRAIVVMS